MQSSKITPELYFIVLFISVSPIPCDISVGVGFSLLVMGKIHVSIHVHFFHSLFWLAKKYTFLKNILKRLFLSCDRNYYSNRYLLSCVSYVRIGWRRSY